MRLYFSAILASIFPLFAVGNAVAACDVADLKFLQNAGYSVADAIQWCKSAAPASPQPAVTPLAAPAAAGAAPPRVDSASATIPPQAAAAASNEKVGAAGKPAEQPGPALPKAPQAGGGAPAATEEKSIAPTASAFLKGWGVGLAYIKNRSPIVSDAVIVNGVVRATTIQNYQTELIFGSHWYFQGSNDATCGPVWIADKPLKAGCLGIFLGVGVGGSNSASQLIDFVGAGLIWGFGDVFNANGGIDAQTKKHSIGIGIGRKFNVKHLGDGFVHNQAPPSGETQIRYDVRDTVAPYLFYTYNF